MAEYCYRVKTFCVAEITEHWIVRSDVQLTHADLAAAIRAGDGQAICQEDDTQIREDVRQVMAVEETA